MNTSSSVNTLQTATAAFEAGAGLALLCFPSVAVALLLGVPLETPASLAVARVGGALILAAAGVRTQPVGILLWPAVVLHVSMTVWCVMSLLSGNPEGPELGNAVRAH